MSWINATNNDLQEMQVQDCKIRRLAGVWKSRIQQCKRTELLLMEQKLVENAKIEKLKCDILGDFQTLWTRMVCKNKSFNYSYIHGRNETACNYFQTLCLAWPKVSKKPNCIAINHKTCWGKHIDIFFPLVTFTLSRL